jgi:hypothetical protein
VIAHQGVSQVLAVRLQIREMGDQEVSNQGPGPDREIEGRGRDQPGSGDDVCRLGQQPTGDDEANRLIGSKYRLEHDCCRFPAKSFLRSANYRIAKPR